jgi:hypothetical protein
MKLQEFAIGLAMTVLVLFVGAGVALHTGISSGPALLVGVVVWFAAAFWLVATMKKPAPQRS